ncbi:integral to plasma membrane protein [Phaffia rhodozyma]|uniref:Protein PNS1 n=1 Tax=Phaffia rhodozyma TaxID=264483 RepID=A0A0F7SF76_PHARH|nr:integral to plasma membrane protein [Phaffia rhodozyma]
MSYPQQPQQAYGQQYQQQNYNQGYNQGQQGKYPEQNNSGPEYQMNAPAPYAQQQYAPPPQNVDYGSKPESGERFNPRKRINDLIPLLLYIATVFGFTAVSGIAIHAYVQNGGLGGGLGSGDTGSGVTLNAHTAYLLALVGAAALLLSILYLMMVRAFTKIILEITLVLTVVFNVALCIYYWIIKYWSGAIIFTIIAVISVLSYWSMRKRIPLARLLLQMVIDISKHHKSVYGVCIIALLVQTALSVWYAFTIAAVYVKWTPDSSACSAAGGSCSSAKVTGLVVFCTFAYLWMSQVIANVSLCTLAGGPYGGWYYYGPSEAYGGNMPTNPCFKAFVRASTMSLGSIAFGSLIVTLLELLRMLFSILEQNARAEGDAIGQILSCVAGCCVSCITTMVEWFNRYAYIEIALYGKSYIPAAKDAWRLMKDRGIDALVNDSLVGMVFRWGAYVIAILCAAFGYLYLRYTNPSYNSNGDYSPVIILYSFLIGFQSGLTLAQALEGGVSTIFVCLGEDPALMAQRNPALFEEIRVNYPRVVEGIPRV